MISDSINDNNKSDNDPSVRHNTVLDSDILLNRLRESVRQEVAEELWRATTDNSYAGYLLLAPEFDEAGEIIDFRIVSVNNTAAKQLESDTQELKGVLVGERFRHVHDAELLTEYKRAYLNNEIIERSYSVPEGGAGAGSWVQQIVPVLPLIVIRNRVAKTPDELRDLEVLLHKDRAKLLERVINEAGHDLRTPLAVIKTSLYLAEKTGPNNPEKLKHYQAQAIDQINRLNDILEELIDVAHLRDRSLDLQVWDASIFLSTIVDDFRDVASQDGKTIQYVPSESEDDCSILISEDKMYRAITNIVRNAISYTNPGGTITLSCETQGEDVHLIISDSGIGITEENMQKIFDRFFRVDTNREIERGHKGMGLGIAKEIIDMHGGDIKVESVVGEGTTFRIVLPRIMSDS